MVYIGNKLPIGSIKGKLLFVKYTGKKHNIAVLDGVRAIACLSVVAFHLNLISNDVHSWAPYPATDFFSSSLMMQGGAGVTLFFVLSGFLLFMPYARALLFEREWPSVRRFYLRRIMRIWPGYYITLLFLILTMKPGYLNPARWSETGLFLTFLMDSTKATFQQLNGPFWTLAVEWQFYMLLPLLALLMQKFVGQGTLRQRWWRLVACLVGLMVWGLTSRLWGAYFAANPQATFLVPRAVLNVPIFFLYGFAGKFLEDFAVGMLISAAFILTQEGGADKIRASWSRKSSPRSGYWLCVVGLAILAIMTLWNGYQRFQPGTAAIFDALIPVYNFVAESGLSIGFGLCIAGLLFGPPALRRPLEWAPIRWIGLISYGMYMWHLPLLIYFTFQVQHRFMVGWNSYLTYAIYWLVVFGIITPFCYLFYRLVERPGIRLGEILLTHIQRRPKAPPPADNDTTKGQHELEAVGARSTAP